MHFLSTSRTFTVQLYYTRVFYIHSNVCVRVMVAHQVLPTTHLPSHSYVFMFSQRHEPTSTFAGAHSLKSLPGGPGPDQPLIPPLPQVHRQHVQASDDSSANQPPDVGSTSCDRIQAAENDSPDETGIGSGSHDHVDVVSSLIAVNGGEGTTQSVIV